VGHHESPKTEFALQDLLTCLFSSLEDTAANQTYDHIYPVLCKTHKPYLLTLPALTVLTPPGPFPTPAQLGTASAWVSEALKSLPSTQSSCSLTQRQFLLTPLYIVEASASQQERQNLAQTTSAVCSSNPTRAHSSSNFTRLNHKLHSTFPPPTVLYHVHLGLKCSFL